jgi:hypothetical protein
MSAREVWLDAAARLDAEAVRYGAMIAYALKQQAARFRQLAEQA